MRQHRLFVTESNGRAKEQRRQRASHRLDTGMFGEFALLYGAAQVILENVFDTTRLKFGVVFQLSR